jgi:hypothetical protein
MPILTKIDRKDAKNARKMLKNANLAVHVASVATAIEAMEQLLVEKGVIQADEVMERLKKIAIERQAQAS